MTTFDTKQSCKHTQLDNTDQRFGHDHFDLLFGKHSELCEKALDDEFPGLELGVDGDAGHVGGLDATLLPAWGGRGGGSSPTHTAVAYRDRGY